MDLKVSKAQIDALDIIDDDFHLEWNYTVNPRHAET
jgi:hypothetical protein